MRSPKRYRIRCWIPVDGEEEEVETYHSLEEAQRDLRHYEPLQPENIYRIEEIRVSDQRERTEERVEQNENQNPRPRSLDSGLKLYLLESLQKLRAGSAEGRELYFPCSECKAREPEIAGYFAFGPQYEDIVVREKSGERYLAFLCRACAADYLKLKSEGREENSQRGGSGSEERT